MFNQFQYNLYGAALLLGMNHLIGIGHGRSDKRAFKNASMAVIPMASHLHQIEQPEIYKTVVRAFLKKICDPAALKT